MAKVASFKKACPDCGADLTGTHRSRRYCAVCQQKKNNARTRCRYKEQKKQKTKKNLIIKEPAGGLTIVEVNTRARAKGLSYGQYLARYGGYDQGEVQS